MTFASVSYRIFGRLTERQCAASKDLQTKLFKAHVFMKDSVFLAGLYMSALLGGLLLSLPAVAVLAALRAPALPLVVITLLAGLLGAVVVYLFGHVFLSNQAVEKAKEIDENLPAGLNYMLALANARMTPRQIWKSLAGREVFGALAVEAERITRDLDVFSCDILTALRNAEARTPSKRFLEFLQGAISAFQSGVDLQTYLKAKGHQFQHESMQTQAQVLDTIGVMAEAFLVVVVAAPLFLIILLTVMAINQGETVILYGYLLTLLFIPISQVMIGAMIRALNPSREG